MKKFFARKCCFCVAAKRKNKGKENPEDESYSNQAFSKSERHFIPLQKDDSQGNLANASNRQRQASLFSNLSEVFRAPTSDERSLGGFILDEYDYKSKTLLSVTSASECDTMEDQTPSLDSHSDKFVPLSNGLPESKIDYLPDVINPDTTSSPENKEQLSKDIVSLERENSSHSKDKSSQSTSGLKSHSVSSPVANGNESESDSSKSSPGNTKILKVESPSKEENLSSEKDLNKESEGSTEPRLLSEKHKTNINDNSMCTNNSLSFRDTSITSQTSEVSLKVQNTDPSSDALNLDESTSEVIEKPSNKNIWKGSTFKKSTEWRDKLRNDLLNEKDEEFMDESEEESEQDLESTSGSSFTLGSGYETDENGLSSKPLSTYPSINKLLGRKPVVIDNGSYLIRGGWAGDFAPTSQVRNIFGRWKDGASTAWQEALGSEFVVGKKAIERHSALSLQRPVEDGRICNWKTMRSVWDFIAKDELNTDLLQQPVLITEPALVDHKQREKMIEVLIETLRVPGACLRSQAAMCALSAGRKVGMVINCGYGTSEVVPIYEGHNLNYATSTMEVGGRHMTEYLSRLIQREHGINFSSIAELEVVNKIKEKCALVENAAKYIDIDRNQSSSLDGVEYVLPDGQVLHLGKERTSCTEPFFSPDLLGISSLGLPSLLNLTLDRMDSDIMAEANNTILLTGGTSNIAGLQERLEQSLSENTNSSNVVIQPTSCGNDAAWVGASLFADQSGFAESCITEDLYFECGANVVHRRCF